MTIYVPALSNTFLIEENYFHLEDENKILLITLHMWWLEFYWPYSNSFIHICLNFFLLHFLYVFSARHIQTHFYHNKTSSTSLWVETLRTMDARHIPGSHSCIRATSNNLTILKRNCEQHKSKHCHPTKLNLSPTQLCCRSKIIHWHFNSTHHKGRLHWGRDWAVSLS